MQHRVTLIAGDGSGPACTRATQRLLGAAGVDIAWDEVPCGQAAFAAGGDALPEAAIASIRANRLALKGKLETPIGAGYESPNVRLRKALGLYAAVRPIQSQPGIPARYSGVDFTIVRECTEDVYAGIEHQVVPGVVQSIKITTRTACERIVRHAFRVAKREGRRRVTLVHKANIMKKADGLFLKVGHEVAAGFPDVAFDAVIADNACMQLVKRPEQFGVLVAQNLFGDLLSDLGAGLIGGVATVWGTLEGEADDGSGIVVFESIHGAAEGPAGDGEASRANPLPMIRAGTALVRHLGHVEAASAIARAIAGALEAGIKTPDLGGTATTEGFVDAVIARLA